MSSQVALTVAYKDDTSQETFVYSGETIVAPCELIGDCQHTTWQLSGTPIQFSATTEPLPKSLGLEQRFQTITFMSIYSHKSIDELRFEDYQYMNVNQRNEKETSSAPHPKTTSPSSRPVSSSYCASLPSYRPSSPSYAPSSPKYTPDSPKFSPTSPTYTFSSPTFATWSSPGMASSSGTSLQKPQSSRQFHRQKKSSAKSHQPGLSSSAFNTNQCSTFGNNDWITTGIEVQMKDNFECKNLQLTGKKGVVQNVYGNMCTVYLYDEKREVNISVRNVKPGEVAKQDKCKIIDGDDRSTTGILINVDYPDGIFKMDDTNLLKILPLHHLAKLGSSPVYPIIAPSIRKGADFQAAFAINLPQKEVLHHEKMSVDSNTEISTSLPSTSTRNFAVTPNINFISETDPASVFTASQPPAAVNEPLSSLSVSEGQQLRNALLESIVKCMQIQNSLYRLVLLKLQAHVTAVTGKTNTYESPSMKGAEMNLNDVPVAQRTESSTERLNNASKAFSMGSPYDTPGPTSMESAVEIWHDTPGISSLDDAEAILSDTQKDSSDDNTVESPNDAPATLLYELKKPLQALTRCTGIQRELFQRLITVTSITSKEETILSELHTEGQVNMLSVHSKLEAIAFKTKMECTHARNPFTNHQPKPSTSEDVVQQISSDKRSFSVAADGGSRSLRDVPHGRGKLETVTGEVVYSGDWCKGKRHGKGECLILSLPGVNNATAEHGFYTGGWKNNMRHGNGKMMFSSGAIYEGQWQFDKMTGYGTLKLPDGTIQEGTWKEGSLQGCALFTWPHGVTEYREYDKNRAQLSFRTIEKDAAENVSKMSSIRSQLLNLHECVTELKDEKLRLTEQLNTQKLEHDQMVGKLHTTVFEIRESFKAQRERESQQQLEELDKATVQVAATKMELEEARAGLLCQICFEQRRDCIILPCSHLLYCRKCVADHKRKSDSRCPTCRGPINSEILCNINHSS